MKKTFLLVAVMSSFLFSFVSAQHMAAHTNTTDEHQPRAQWRDFVVNATIERHNHKAFAGGSIRIIAEEPNVFFDVRMAMPHGPTVTFGVGYPFRLSKDGCFVISPALYLHAGTFTGISPGFVMRYEKKKWFVISTNQFLLDPFRNHPHHLFSTTTFDYRLTKWLDLGGEFEMFAGKKPHTVSPPENNLEYINHVTTHEFMFGPQFRFRIKRNNVEFTMLQNLLESNVQRFVFTYAREF